MTTTHPIHSEKPGQQEDRNHHEDQRHLDRRAHGHSQPGADAGAAGPFQVAVEAQLSQHGPYKGSDQHPDNAEEQSRQRAQPGPGGGPRAGARSS